ncbi:uncharacterized protein MYCFIDRAFT_196406 [Pseudocercospora fijiensis CIRAD86]|uniref:Uncharacterized protein n=1 Tax=Pseudocercospora fijiensis (strain CIRAD86) TaxID=383855 RepID=M3AEI1_PSEFD|nr:uncharacterized protein MYCFIDRAFT_196406 [Pseudocercospora fijiensis CIRAD86]EME83006.1 hypothetical protein MYCFIDRAFT_196406 [Pseudocercospora fijiensis CIRAD86]
MTTTTTKGILRFSIPDESVTAEQRAFFATPQNKDFVKQEAELLDFNNSDIVKGAQGLDVQGFTWIHHKSQIATSENACNGKFFEGSNIEDLYLPELERLIENVTGCKKAVVWNGVTRRKLPVRQDGQPTVQQKKGGEQDRIFDALRRDVPTSRSILLLGGGTLIDEFSLWKKCSQLPRTSPKRARRLE